jgi:hypothetical protein
LGTAGIARKNWQAIRHAENCTLTAVANMFRKFAALALSGRPDDSWGIMVLTTQRVLDACLQSAASEGRMVEIGAAGISE